MVYPPETSGPGGFARRARASGVSIRRRFLTRLSLIALPLSVTLLLLGGVVPAIATPVFVSGWGAQEGLHRFDPDSGIFTQLNASGPDNPDLAIGLDGTIWLTNRGSLAGYDPVTGSLTAFISGGYRAVATELSGTLIVSGWGAQGGLHRFDPDSGIFTQLNASGPDNPDLAIGSDGTIWLTTFSGGYRAVATAPIPEPSTGLLLGLGLVFIASANRRLRAAPPQR